MLLVNICIYILLGQLYYRFVCPKTSKGSIPFEDKENNGEDLFTLTFAICDNFNDNGTTTDTIPIK